jgi:predicted Zn-dependent protease
LIQHNPFSASNLPTKFENSEFIIFLTLDSPMKKNYFCPLLLGTLTLLLGGCYTVPETGRTTLNLLPESTLSEQSALAFTQMRQEATVTLAKEPNDRVLEVGRRVLAAARKTADLPPFEEWEFVVFDDDSVINAFAMPGGKVGVYTGILHLASTDDELAAIIGHEIAHVVARHGNERVSQALLFATGGLAVGYAVREEDDATQQAILIAYGIGATLGATLPFSRLHENESDEIGLLYMARAGYDPRAAPMFWEKMKQAGGDSPPEFLSTHPSNETRIRRLNELMPKALEEYRKSEFFDG